MSQPFFALLALLFSLNGPAWENRVTLNAANLISVRVYDGTGFGGGMNFYAYANGNPITYLDPFGLGAVTDNFLTPSWIDIPTPEEKQVQQFLSAAVNLVTLGAANLISAATTGTDLTGNQLNTSDAVEQSLQTAAFVGAVVTALPSDGATLEADAVLEGTDIGLGDLAAGSADAISTGNLGGELASPSQLSDFAEYLNQNGMNLQIGNEYLPEGVSGGFNAAEQTVILNDNPTVYEMLHESLHAEQYLDLGSEAYSAQTTAQKEQYVFDKLNNTPEYWDSLNPQEQAHAIWYVQKSGGFR